MEEAASQSHQSKQNLVADDQWVKFKRSHLYAALLPLAFVAGLAVGFLFWGRTPAVASTRQAGAAPAADQAEAPGAARNEPDAQQAAQAQNVPRYDVPIDDDPTLGPASAAITIIEFSDYECPYCRRWHAEVFPRLMETYSGQIRFVYRDFPLSSIHANAEPAAQAANCAGEQGAYWDYNARLFNARLGLNDKAYRQYASDLSLDTQAFEACLQEGRFASEVKADYDFAANLGVRSTPTFFINGIALVGAQPFEVFQEVIDKELAGEIP
jgi:protein-disulfide isomerase